MSTSYYYSYGDGDKIIVEINEQPQEFISIPKFDEVDFVENDEADSSYSGEINLFTCTHNNQISAHALISQSAFIVPVNLWKNQVSSELLLI